MSIVQLPLVLYMVFKYAFSCTIKFSLKQGIHIFTSEFRLKKKHIFGNIVRKCQGFPKMTENMQMECFWVDCPKLTLHED